MIKIHTMFTLEDPVFWYRQFDCVPFSILGVFNSSVLRCCHCSKPAVSSVNLLIHTVLQSCSHSPDTEPILGCVLVFREKFISLRNVTVRMYS